jgi:hypothetical protein
MTNKFLLFVGCVLILLTPVTAGELYEVEDYLSATIGINPYGDGPPPVNTPRTPTSPSPSDNPFNPSPNDPAPVNSPPTPNSGDSGSDGNGNYNQIFGFGNQSSGSWTVGTKSGTQNRQTSETRDYLTQAILSGNGTIIRSRGKYARPENITKPKVESVPQVSAIPRLFREASDKRIVFKKIQKAIKNPYAGCYSTAFVVNDCSCDGYSLAVPTMIELRQDILTICLA